MLTRLYRTEKFGEGARPMRPVKHMDYSRFYDDSYEIIEGTKVRTFEIEGPYAHMLPETKKENKKLNAKKIRNLALIIIPPFALAIDALALIFR
jgi:hypothetical protein